MKITSKTEMKFHIELSEDELTLLLDLLVNDDYSTATRVLSGNLISSIRGALNATN